MMKQTLHFHEHISLSDYLNFQDYILRMHLSIQLVSQYNHRLWLMFYFLLLLKILQML